MKRRAARETAFILVFELTFAVAGGESAAETAMRVYDTALSCRPDEVEESPYVRAALRGVAENLDAIDARITRRLSGWSLDRVSRVSLALMRLAAYEMTVGGIPHTVAINEAIELCKLYDDPEAVPYLNGVLNAIAEDAHLKSSKEEREARE